MSPESPVPPPGWYPDEKRRSQERFSDGFVWTGETRTRPWWRLLTPPGLQTRRSRILLAVGVVLLLAATLGALLADPAQDEVSAADLASGSEGPALPAAERGFLAIVADGQAASDGASDVKVVNERRIRGEALCAFLPESLRVREWRGVVSGLDKGAVDDDAELRVWLARDVELVGVDGSIEPDSDLYDDLADLTEGDAVVVSGRFVAGDHCIEEGSTFDSSQMLTPDFSFRFTAVQRLADDS